MTFAAAVAIGNTLLYEGYVLYPYRAASVKNRMRWTFGGIYPDAYSREQTGADASSTRTEVLVRGTGATRVAVKVRFLQLSQRTAAQFATKVSSAQLAERESALPVAELRVGARTCPTWQEAIEHEIESAPLSLGALALAPRVETFSRAKARSEELVHDALEGVYVGKLLREQQALLASVTIAAHHLEGDVYRLTVSVSNDTVVSEGGSMDREAALFHTLHSAHTVLHATGGAFVSMTDPGPTLSGLARGCRNEGAWPVLVGREGTLDTMLASPIVLYDYPRVSPESPGDLFDATEIDEILTLRILTMTDDEKREMRATDGAARALLERTEALGPRELADLHGRLQRTSEPSARSGVRATAGRLTLGDRVRICPRVRADAMDIILAGRIATVRSIEQDFEDRVHVVVTVDEDPGADLGIEGQVGHRFFYGVDELELVEAAGGTA